MIAPLPDGDVFDELARTNDDYREAAALRFAGHSADDVLRWTYLTPDELHEAEQGTCCGPLPSPPEIEAMTAEIRRRWTAEERQTRQWAGRDRWMVPMVAAGPSGDDESD